MSTNKATATVRIDHLPLGSPRAHERTIIAADMGDQGAPTLTFK